MTLCTACLCCLSLLTVHSKLVYATALIREQQCLFIATNLDHADAISNNSSSNGDGALPVGRVMPGTGSLVAAVQVASGVQPVSQQDRSTLISNTMPLRHSFAML